MIAVRFRKEAEADLRGIIGWYEGVAPDAVANILSDIYRSIDQLARYPRSGIASARSQLPEDCYAEISFQDCL
jgi:plasmid stabilization system protein ParE